MNIALRLSLTTTCLLAWTTDLSAQGPYAPLPDKAKAQIDAVLPAQAPVQVAQPRRLLIYDGNVGYGGHRSIAFANYAFTSMGERTGAFSTVVSHDPAVFRRDHLAGFDAVCLNNTVGNLFDDEQLRQNLLEFVLGGGGLLGIHGTTVAFTDFRHGAKETWPEFGRMIGGRGASHLAPDERVVIKLDCPDHPLTRPFGGQGFEHVSEFFRVRGPYSRDRVRVLMSIDTARTQLPAKGSHPSVERDDDDYALAWTRNYGRGRVVYCTIGHSPGDFMTPKILEFYLGALQFVLGDLPGPTTPSNRLSPAVLAQEKLGWRLGVTMWGLHKFTLFEGIDKTRQLGLSYVGGLSFQKVSKDIPKNFDANLSDEQLRAVRMKMDDAGVRMPTCFYARIPADEAGCRKVFEFGPQAGHRDVHLGAAAGVARRDRTLLRRIRHQPRHPQPRPEAIARLLAARGRARGVPGTEQADRGVSRHRLLVALGHRPGRGHPQAGRAADHDPARTTSTNVRPRATTSRGAPARRASPTCCARSTGWASGRRCSAWSTRATSRITCPRWPRAWSSSTG